jgi:predicted  nucleic acid-binding Zn-ribbon protein
MPDKGEILRDVWGDTSAGGLTSEASGIRYSSAGQNYTADPGSIVSRFRSIDAREDTFGHSLPELDLPGFGEAYDDCGDDIPRFCADCGATHTVGRTCYRSTCPRCGAAWTRRQATAVSAKLEATRRYLESSENSAGWAGYKFHHITLSPPEGFETFSNESLDRTFDILKEVLDELGVRTGVMFYHPWSGSHDGDDLGEWKGRLFEGREWSDVREELEHRPHFHAVVIAKHVDGSYVTRAIEEQTGWIVERLTKGEESDVSIYDKYDLCRVVSYCLSHTGLRENESGRTRAAYRYFGRVANLPAADHIEAEIDAAMRSVVPRTLDLSWSSLACEKGRDDREAQSWLVADPESAAAGRQAGRPADGDGEQDGEVPGPSPPDNKCAGRILHLSRAPEFLGDSEWREAAPRSEELAETWDEWEDEIEEPPPTD